MTENSGLTNVRAQALFARTVGSRDRLLVTGATGWFGRTAVHLISQLGAPSLYLASRSRTVSVGSTLVEVHTYDAKEIANFAPTVVIDCAFLTRDLISSMPLSHYVSTNERLTDQLMEVASLPTVARLVSFSSGAAVYPRDALEDALEENPYGWMKRQSEKRLAEFAATAPVSVAIARAWSVSGSLVQKPRSYALSDMIIQAATSRSIHIQAAHLVYRRYTSVEDLLAVALALTGEPGFSVVDSAGELVEMERLAELVRDVVRPGASITRPAMSERRADRYYAEPESWDSACETVGMSPEPLEEQIRLAAGGVLATGD